MAENLNEKLDKVIELLEKDGNKKVKIPKLSRAKMKKGYSLVLVIRSNGLMNIYKLQIQDNVVKVPSLVKGELPTYHEASAEHVMFYKKYPVLIITEWSEVPFSKASMMEKAKLDETLTFPQKIIYTRLRRDAITPKKSIGGIILILAIIIGGIVALNYFGVFGWSTTKTLIMTQ